MLVLVFVKSLWFEDGFEWSLGLGFGIGLWEGLGLGGPSERVQRGSYWTDWDCMRLLVRSIAFEVEVVVAVLSRIEDYYFFEEGAH